MRTLFLYIGAEGWGVQLRTTGPHQRGRKGMFRSKQSHESTL